MIQSSVVRCLRKGKKLDSLLYGCPLTITKVVVTADLKIAYCYFMPFNTTLTIDALSNALESSKYDIRRFVTSEVNLKYSPELRFYYDQAFEQSLKLNELLDSVDNPVAKKEITI
ncbi:MAG: ribosome-binding factor A [Rickettsiaceae bacterium]|nr:ribosome-binding factor A [Rickettsiaceae bacterium]